MDKDKLEKINKVAKTIEKLETLKDTLNSRIDKITIIRNSDSLNVLYSNPYTSPELREIDTKLIEVMATAGLKYIDKVLKTKQQEFNKLFLN